MSTLIFKDLGNGISCIDAQYVRTGLASCYLIEQNGHAAFIDMGTNNTVPLLLEILEQKNIPLSNVDYVIPTHVHLDHAGGAGQLMQHAPNARLIIHPRGARHMIDPSRLQAGASAVYGEAEFKKHYGDLIPIDKERVTEAPDGFGLYFQGRKLLFLDTPGHAKHHFCIIDKASKGMFTGDTFGVAYPELTAGNSPFIFPPSSPVDFDPDAWINSIDRLIASGSNQAFLTHYGAVSNLDVLAADLKNKVATFADFARSADSTEKLGALVTDYLVQEALLNNPALSREKILDVLSLDLDLVIQGLAVWIERTRKK
ncbi:MAG: MBL fold metallo-hydrolase [Cycloclasticus sp. symbiont of Bathymodiolus heckerae]|nr:MAG: MBL fold metallo-hydrolase [Cycloclasticus sp. symbiont of Bathymodiolus heckerae]